MTKAEGEVSLHCPLYAGETKIAGYGFVSDANEQVGGMRAECQGRAKAIEAEYEVWGLWLSFGLFGVPSRRVQYCIGLS
jgi:hypothetical protein